MKTVMGQGKNSDNDISIVVTKEDLTRLSSEIEVLKQSVSSQEEVFFKFDNYTHVVYLRNLSDAESFLNKGIRFYYLYPNKQFWTTIHKT